MNEENVDVKETIENTDLSSKEINTDQLQWNTPSIEINFNEFEKNNINGIVSISGFRSFEINFDGYRSFIKAAIPLPSSNYMQIVDMMVKFYYAGKIGSNEIGYDLNSGKSFIRNKEGDIKNASYGNIRSERKRNKEISGYFFPTA